MELVYLLKKILLVKKLITIIETNIHNLLLFSLHQSLCGFKITGGVIYIEPENSIYAKSDVFESIENSLITYVDLSNLLILGDFNARTGINSEFIKSDKYNLDVNDDDVKVVERIDNEELLRNYGISDIRCSMDKKTNNYGYKLLTMCTNLGLIIANGRCGRDSLKGKMACKDASVVDYMIASPRIFGCLYNFDVLAFNELLSDIHCSIHIEMKISDINNIEPVICIDKGNAFKRPKWKEEFNSTFIDNISRSDIDRIELSINSLTLKEYICQTDIDYIYNMIKQAMYDSAKACGYITNIRNVNNHNKPTKRAHSNVWWNSDCENKRKTFNLARKNNMHDRSEQANLKRKQSSKEYKNAIKRANSKYHQELNSKIRSLQSNNPKDFWKLINGNYDKTDTCNEISIDDFAEHFQNLNTFGVTDETFDINCIPFTDDSPLNKPITKDEVNVCIAKLKNNKACGYDKILNEYIKCSANLMSDIYVSLFNLILNTGVVPDDWVTGIIKPIFKNRGSKQNVDNYRGITLLSCLGKLFTYILNERLKVFLELNNILCEEQAGFRQNYSTSDHLFSLNFIVSLYISKGKKLYGAFIDYRKAFDSVHRVTLWRKLISNNIDGLLLRVIFNMYNKAKSCIKNGMNISHFFDCNTGVRQGENLSPILFALFLNDLTTYLSNRYDGLVMLSSIVSEQLSDEMTDVFLKLFVLLYADDTIILAESVDQLQKALNGMAQYCHDNKLNVNESKSKIIVFSKGKIRKMPNFALNGVDLNVVFSYSYLGVAINYNGSFKIAQKALYDKASRAMFELLSKCRKLRLPIDISIKLFDSVVKPIMLYGCEIWGYDNSGMADKLQLRFLKIILGLKKCTTSVMVRGETGCYPMYFDITYRILTFWLRLVNTTKHDKISKILYNCMYAMFLSNSYCSPWIVFVKNSLDRLGLSYIFDSQGYNVNNAWFGKIVKLRLHDCYRQTWTNELEIHENCDNYRLYKMDFCFENYLIDLPWFLGKCMLKFRTRNSLLPVTKQFYNGRINNIFDQIRCPLCNDSHADEFHYILNCKHFTLDRKRTFGNYIVSKPCNILTFQNIMNTSNTNNIQEIRKLANFMRHVNTILGSS